MQCGTWRTLALAVNLKTLGLTIPPAVELLKEAVPGTSRMAGLANPETPRWPLCSQR
jgi:hypothetical protein